MPNSGCLHSYRTKLLPSRSIHGRTKLGTEHCGVKFSVGLRRDRGVIKRGQQHRGVWIIKDRDRTTCFPRSLTPPSAIWDSQGGPKYVFSVVGTSRCDVRAACSGATLSDASPPRCFVPPAITRAGTAQRAIPTIT